MTTTSNERLCMAASVSQMLPNSINLSLRHCYGIVTAWL